jgi:hypothetical protein
MAHAAPSAVGKDAARGPRAAAAAGSDGLMSSTLTSLQDPGFHWPRFTLRHGAIAMTARRADKVRSEQTILQSRATLSHDELLWPVSQAAVKRDTQIDYRLLSSADGAPISRQQNQGLQIPDLLKVVNDW